MAPVEMDIRELTGQWNYDSLPSNVKLGPGCFLERHESFRRYRSQQRTGLTLGANVVVYTWTDFNIEPLGQLTVGDDSVLVGAVFMCAQHISIGKRVLISYHVTIADSDFHPMGVEARRLDAIANAPGGDRSSRPVVQSRPVVIEDDVWIGIGALILKGVHIGEGARVAAGAVVTRDVAPRTTVAGNPARVVDEQSA